MAKVQKNVDARAGGVGRKSEKSNRETARGVDSSRDRAKKATRPRVGTEAHALLAAQEAAGGWPRPPAGILKRELVFWDAIVRARLPGEWARVDLAHVLTLARTWSDLEVHRVKLRREGDLIRNKVTGVALLNPRLRLVETLARRSMALTRVLCLHARITLAGGTKDEAAEGKAAATQAAAAADELGGDDDLIARPTLQ